MKKMLMLGTSPNSVKMVEYAKRLGVYTITTDYLPPEKSAAKLVSDEYWMINTADVDTLERRCKEEGINAVTDGNSQFNRDMMVELCHRLNLPCYSTPKTNVYENDKAVFKRACREVGARVPKDYYVSPALTQEELERIEYPVIVKPVDQSANCGVSYCYCPDDVRKAYEEVRRVSDNPNTIIEQMIHGKEYHVRYAVANGEVKFLDLEENILVEGKPKCCYVLLDMNCEYRKTFLKETNDQKITLLKHLGCKEGYAWVQIMREQDGTVYLIEMGYRLGGGATYLSYPERHGLDTIEWMTNCALGIPNDISAIDRDPPQKKYGIGYLLWTDKAGTVSNVIGLEELEKYPGLHVQNAACKGKWYDQYTYPIRLSYAYNTVEEAISMIRFVNDNLRLLDENGDNMLFYYTDYELLRERLA